MHEGIEGAYMPFELNPEQALILGDNIQIAPVAYTAGHTRAKNSQVKHTMVMAEGSWWHNPLPTQAFRFLWHKGAPQMMANLTSTISSTAFEAQQHVMNVHATRASVIMSSCADKGTGLALQVSIKESRGPHQHHLLHLLHCFEAQQHLLLLVVAASSLPA